MFYIILYYIERPVYFMDNSARKICRLCLHTIYIDDNDDFEAISTQILEPLILEVNLEISAYPVMCKNCASAIKKFTNFKLSLVNTENRSNNNCEGNIKMNIEESCVEEIEDEQLVNVEVGCMEGTENEHLISIIHKPCHICMNLTKGQCLIPLYETKENIFMVDILKTHFPELNLNGPEVLEICKGCLETLQSLVSFITNCLNVEEKIKNYVEIEGTNNEGQIDLIDVQQFTFIDVNMDKFRPKQKYDETVGIIMKAEKLDDFLEINDLDFKINIEENQIISEIISENVDESNSSKNKELLNTSNQANIDSNSISYQDNQNIFESTLLYNSSEKKVDISDATDTNLYSKSESKDAPVVSETDVCQQTTVSTFQVSDSRTKSNTYRRDHCFYCETDVLHFARHLQRSHLGEIEVQTIFSKPVKSIERKDLITLLRKKGNFKKNCNNGCVRPMKKGNSSNSSDDFAPCKYCLGFYLKRQLWKHVKRCKSNPDKSSKSHRYRHQVDGQNLLIHHLKIDNELKTKVFPHMAADSISLLAKKDGLICAFGAKYLRTHRKQRVIHVCAGKMRELAKLLKEMINADSEIKNLFNALRPKYFNLMVTCTKIVAKFDITNEVYKSPTVAINIGNSLKQCCDIAIQHVLKKSKLFQEAGLVDAEANIKAVMQLLTVSWKSEVSSKANENLLMRKFNKTSFNELGTDLEKLSRPSTSCASSSFNSRSLLKQVNVTQFLAHSEGKNRVLVPWTYEQTQIVKEYFKEHIKNKIAPKKRECDGLKSMHNDILHNKTWLKIKVYVQNCYTKKLR